MEKIRGSEWDGQVVEGVFGIPNGGAVGGSDSGITNERVTLTNHPRLQWPVVIIMSLGRSHALCRNNPVITVTCNRLLGLPTSPPRNPTFHTVFSVVGYSPVPKE